jgi:urease accessory protein
MLLADARLPTSGHTQSGGLEPALRDGLDPSRLVDYCRTRLATVTLTEAATAVVCRHRALAGQGTQDVELAWAARTPSDAQRAASRAIGRAYRRLALHLWPSSPCDSNPSNTAPGNTSPSNRAPGNSAPNDSAPGSSVLWELETVRHPSRPRVLGLVAAAGGLSSGQLVRLVGYDDVQTVVSASLKLIPGDPMEAARWVLGLHEDIESMVPICADLVDPQAIPALSAPLMEGWAQDHAIATRRLFSA